MSHQRQMEWREKQTPQEWRGYQRLGAAVIASAVRDLEKPTRVGGEFVSWSDAKILVGMTRHQVYDSPKFDSNRVDEQSEAALDRYYGLRK